MCQACTSMIKRTMITRKRRRTMIEVTITTVMTYFSYHSRKLNSGEHVSAVVQLTTCLEIATRDIHQRISGSQMRTVKLNKHRTYLPKSHQVTHQVKCRRRQTMRLKQASIHCEQHSHHGHSCCITWVHATDTSRFSLVWRLHMRPPLL